MKKAIYILFVFAFLIGCASNAKSPAPSPEAPDYAPDFSLVDVSGNEVRLSDFKGQKNVVLVIYARHDWPHCIAQLGELQNRISEIESLDAQVIAISSKGDQSDVESTKRFLNITYILIPLPNRKVVESFGVMYNSYGSAFATIIVDKKGRIRFKSLDEYNNRTSASRIIRELQGI